MTVRQVGIPGAISFLVRREMSRDHAQLIVSYMTTGLMSSVTLAEGRYKIDTAAVWDGSGPQFSISVRPLTTLEREAEAVAKYVCPACRAGAGSRCRRPTGGLLKHPHPSRAAKVREEQP